MEYNAPEKPTVSYSSYSKYDECPRKWLYDQLADHIADPHKWEAKKQKTLSPWATYSGKVVEATINDALVNYRDTGTWPEDMHEQAKRYYLAGWKFSKDWAWHIHSDAPGKWPKRHPFQPLDRHYYPEGFSELETGQIRRAIRTCIDNFQQSSIREFIASFPLSAWRGPRAAAERTPRFMLGQAPVYAALDFALVTAEVTYIIDWKCGKRGAWSEQSARDQLLWYALYATEQWGIPLERIRVAAVWLAFDAELRFREVDAYALNDLRERIADRHRHLVRKIRFDHRGTIALTDWELSETPRPCGTCQFRGVCEGSKRPLPAASVSEPLIDITL